VGRDGIGSCDLYQSQKIGDDWTEPKNLGHMVNSPDWESQPSLSADGRTLYFVSDRRGGSVGRRDIWVSVLNDKGERTRAKNVGKPVNSVYDEISPFIHANNRTLYFASNGLTGFGGYDLFYAEKDTADAWSTPVILGAPVNNHEDQFSLFITADGKKIGKSLSNAIDPFRLIARYGVDAVRYYLLAHLHTSKDGDFREDLLKAAYTAELAGKLGNLVQRVCALVERSDVIVDPVTSDSEICEIAQQVEARVASAFDEFALHDGLRAIFELVAAGNRYLDGRAPWQLAKTHGNSAALTRCLSTSVHALRVTARLLAPFLPGTASEIGARLEPRPHGGPPLFPPLPRD